MLKRGQATILIFFAIIILVIILLIFFIKSKVYVGGANIESLARELDPITRHIEVCLFDSTVKYTNLIAQQGGYITPRENTYKLYQDQKISYLCYNKPRLSQCLNRYLTLENIKEQLKQAINLELDTCLKVKSFEKSGYTLTLGNKNVEVDIGSDNIITTLNYPVKIRKGTLETEVSSFKKAVPLPLGRLYDAATDIINSEALFGAFDPLTYSLIKSRFSFKQYVIQRLQPYPDRLYILKIKNVPDEKNPFIFQFFIEGEE